jgi:hypothetical protein
MEDGRIFNLIINRDRQTNYFIKANSFAKSEKGNINKIKKVI